MKPGPAGTRVALITGAAGGLGSGLVGEFLGQGWQVALGYHQTQPTPTPHEHSFALHLDVTDRASVEKGVKAILEKWGRIDALVNNAGLTADGSLWQLSESEWDKVMAVNLKGAFLCCRAALPIMLRQRSGHIVNISSFSGRAGQSGQANYAAAKAGVIGLTQSLAKETGSRNIRVNAVLPGVLSTGMTAHLGEERMKNFASANALGRINSVGEVARFVAFLAATENVSGQVFQLDSRIAPWT
jgi:3-oxoacyl-[acyl-carrier protein] reductase